MRLVDLGRERSRKEAGITLSSAPESMRKCFPEFLSELEMVEERCWKGASAEAIVDRPRVDQLRRFPTRCGKEPAVLGPAWNILPIDINTPWFRNVHGHRTRMAVPAAVLLLQRRQEPARVVDPPR